MTDWNAFRELSTHTSCGSVVEWAAQVNETVRRATTETVTESDIPALDSRLAHMLEARRSLQRRWKRNRTNKTLRKRVARLGKEIEA